jgi:ATP-dependent Zn protease
MFEKEPFFQKIVHKYSVQHSTRGSHSKKVSKVPESPDTTASPPDTKTGGTSSIEEANNNNNNNNNNQTTEKKTTKYFFFDFVISFLMFILKILCP